MRNFILFLLILALLAAHTAFAATEKKVGTVKTLWRKVLSIFRNPVKELTPLPAKADLQSGVKPKEAVSEKPPAEEKTEKHSLAEMPKEEIIERIHQMLKISPEIYDFIPELKAVFDKERNVVSVSYKSEDSFVDLDALDKDTLVKVYIRVNNERIRIQTERIQRQLEAVRASQNIPKTPPQVHIPPRPPEVPKPPQSPPKIPAPPPSPKRR